MLVKGHVSFHVVVPAVLLSWEYTKLTLLLSAWVLPASPQLRAGTGLKSSMRGNTLLRRGSWSIAPRQLYLRCIPIQLQTSWPMRFKYESYLALSLLLLTVLNLLSLKTQLQKEILAPRLKRGGIQLSQMLGCSEAQGRSSGYYFLGKKYKRDRFSGISLWAQVRGWGAGLSRSDSTGSLGAFLLPGWLAALFSSGLFLCGEQFIPRFMEGEKECFNCHYYVLKDIYFFSNICS